MDKIELPEGYLLEALTRWSYFPTQKDECEFIPSLHSTKFTPEVALALAEIPLRKDGYDQVEFRLTRHNLSTRPLSIPHPAPYAHLCKTLAENEKNIIEQVDIYNNPHSLIKPAEHQCGKLIIMDYEDPIEKSERLINQSFGKNSEFKRISRIAFPVSIPMQYHGHLWDWTTPKKIKRTTFGLTKSMPVIETYEGVRHRELRLVLQHPTSFRK